MKKRELGEKRKDSAAVHNSAPMERPTSITIYFILAILGLLGSIYSFSAASSMGASILGARVTGTMLTLYEAFWMAVTIALIYGIWKRKEWVPSLAIATLAAQIIITAGQFFFIEETLRMALANAPQTLTQSEMAQAIEMGKTISYAVMVVTILINALFMRAFHKNKDYFSEK
ncbi:MAG: hypothetical protein V1835_06120 [Candidatus Micrarchaeota archaeon]